MQSVARRQKQKSAQAAKALQSAKSTTNPESPPIPISATTKTQLGAFAFQKPLDPSLEIEPPCQVMGKGIISANVPEFIEDSCSSPEKENPQILPLNECPQTPAPRPPLKDLVKIRQDGQPPIFNIASDMSPDERIVWQVSPRGTPTQVTPATKRQKRMKRARSSSPIGSPRATPASKRLPHPSRAPKTPHADPANDVWQRYSSTSSSARLPHPPGAPLIARLFSAERMHGLNLSPLGLRRSYSCGPDWPPVGLKRRKTACTEDADVSGSLEQIAYVSEEAEPTIQPIVFPRRQQVKSKMSRVNMLLNKVHEKLAKVSTPPEHQASSSSPPESGRFNIPSSPTTKVTSRRINQYIPLSRATSSKRQDDSFDHEEYDDFDNEIELAMFEKVDEAVVAYTQQHQKPRENDAIHNTAVPATDFDEFGFEDEDESLLGIDVDTLISKQRQAGSPPVFRAQLQKHSEVKSGNRVPTQEAAEVVAEFGDIDFGDWDDDDLGGIVRISACMEVG